VDRVANLLDNPESKIIPGEEIRHETRIDRSGNPNPAFAAFGL